MQQTRARPNIRPDHNGTQRAQFESNKRIIPACAGKSGRVVNRTAPHQDHPRVCGEKRLPAVFHDEKLGSPPRVRGKALFTSSHFCATRITPACAGKSDA